MDSKNTKFKTHLACKLCDKSFRFNFELKRHVAIFHQKQRPHKCKYCSKKFARKGRLKNPTDSTHFGIRHKCHLCSALLASKEYLNRHIRNAHNRVTRYSCMYCEKSYTSKHSLRSHVNVIHEDNKHSFQCNTCDKVFLRQSSLYCHKIRHAQEKLHKCCTCSMKFYTEIEKKRHEFTHKPLQKSFECDTCKKLYVSKTCLHQHISRSHHARGKVSCVFCGKDKAGLKVLYDHIRRHIQEKYHECELCEKSFYTSSKKNQHMRMHTGELFYKCKVCSKSFSFRENLRRHELKHLKDKPNKCVFCGMGFTSRELLWNHILRKIGENAFSCKICEKDFTTKPLLRQHMLVHQPGKFKCDKCGMVFRRLDGLKMHSKNMHDS